MQPSTIETLLNSVVDQDWPWVLIALIAAIPLSTIVFLFTLPTHYDHQNPDFVEEIRPDRSMADLERIEKEAQEGNHRLPTPGHGYAHFNKHRETNRKLRYAQSCTIVVLGDIARSPRMMYHAASLAKRNARVEIVGYVESPLPMQVTGTKHIRVHPLKALPKALEYLPFTMIAPLKLLHQSWMLYHALCYRVKTATMHTLLQLPPSMPALAVCLVGARMRNSKLVCDWHNTASSVLSLRFGRNQNHPTVWLLRRYELGLAPGAFHHLAVSEAMKRYLVTSANVPTDKITVVRDRPAEMFRPLASASARNDFLRSCVATSAYVENLTRRDNPWKLVVSSTSWTADEDFGVLLEALVQYSASSESAHDPPNLLVVVTGKGPRKATYEGQIRKLQQQQKLDKVAVKTAFLPLNDYANLLACADIGVCLHNSSSGLDLPMKVADMFGAGLPVLAWSGYEAFSELVQEGSNGQGFQDAEALADALRQLLGEVSRDKLISLQKGAIQESRARWDDTWEDTVAKTLAISQS
ncbi:MAG: hypothetical protein Q9159_004522 [Coniocarpon cinnabarinum]